MSVKFIISVIILLILSCNNASEPKVAIKQDRNIDIANTFIDAFYSFNRDTLQASLMQAKASQPGILYYQKWAECGNYKVMNRGNVIEKNDSLVICPITVKDDLIGALPIDFNVTDTFHILIKNGQIRSVNTSSNDPPLYYEAKAWVRKQRPELIEKPCEGIWEGGPTPCECVQGMVKGFVAFQAGVKIG